MTDILICLKENKTLRTSPFNIIRDYVHPYDLSNLVKACFEMTKNNMAFDVKSKKPISKMELLNYFNQYYGLKYEIIEDYGGKSLTGEKLNYCSEFIDNTIINFKPSYSSLESIESETKSLMSSYLKV